MATAPATFGEGMNAHDSGFDLPGSAASVWQTPTGPDEKSLAADDTPGRHSRER